jgi:CubicO group peptidase (beta-lactamase class C family)/D-alanyl-D-alanine dipeptidase
MKALCRSYAVVALALAFIYACGTQPDAIGPRSDYATVAEELERVITYEMQDKDLPAVSIALVDDQEVVWAKGFGMADPDAKVPATARTVYRVGSVSKLFTDIGIMQLVERGELDLDAPVTQYLPDFQPNNPFSRPITLRQLMSHRSGLVREPPVGNYFDPGEPSLQETVRSLNRTALVYKPETRTKYSNAGIAVVGYVLERLKGTPFSEYLKKSVLEPLGMGSSSFAPEPNIVKDLATASMWTYDGRVFQAPTFELGEAPAGSMYSTVLDLSRFMSVLFNGGRGPEGQILKPETLEEMWTPQYPAAGEKIGFGLGFAISDFQGRRRIGHAGAIYGFATQLFALPEEKLGVVAVTTMDVANSVMRRIAEHGLSLMLANRDRRPLPKLRLTSALDPDLARRLDGRYRSGKNTLDLIERDGRLFMTWGEYRLQVKSLGDTLIVDDRLAFGPRIIPTGDELVVAGKSYSKILVPQPAPAPQRWKGLIGEYGWDHNTLYILEKDEQLYALIEWFFFYPLREINRDIFAFPDYGLYHGEKLIFSRDDKGRATQVEAANVVFKRRPVGTEEGVTFRITPVKPVEELRQTALAAKPPRESGDFRAPDLVDLSTLNPTIKFDIRYATTNNFMGEVFYDQPKAFLQRPAAEALLKAHLSLKKKGYGLLIHDAYRPWYVTKMFWDATPEEMKIFVADPAEGSRHNRGSAVDLTLYDLRTGRPVEMVGGYDEFSPRSYPDYPGGTSLQRWHRELLRDAMEEQGFQVYRFEWWHFDYKDWREYPILNLTFDEIEP